MKKQEIIEIVNRTIDKWASQWFGIDPEDLDIVDLKLVLIKNLTRKRRSS